MTDVEAIATMVDEHDEDGLARLPPDAVAAFVLALGQGDERLKNLADFDHLTSAGVTLARAGLEDADWLLLDWLVRNPSERVLDNAAGLLQGLWIRDYRRRPVDMLHLDALIRARNALIIGEE